jgi:hypothetical protein
MLARDMPAAGGWAAMPVLVGLLATEPPELPEHVRPVLAAGPYESLSEYCEFRGCDPRKPTLKRKLRPVLASPWTTVEILRVNDASDVTCHLMLRTDAGWFGHELACFHMASEETSSEVSKLECRDWLPDGTPEILVTLQTTSARVQPEYEQWSGTDLVVCGIGASKLVSCTPPISMSSRRVDGDGKQADARTITPAAGGLVKIALTKKWRHSDKRLNGTFRMVFPSPAEPPPPGGP